MSSQVCFSFHTALFLIYITQTTCTFVNFVLFFVDCERWMPKLYHKWQSVTDMYEMKTNTMSHWKVTVLSLQMPGHYREEAKKKENERKLQCQSDQQRKADQNKKNHKTKIRLHQAKTIASKLTIINKKTTDYRAEKSVKYAKITYKQQAS